MRTSESPLSDWSSRRTPRAGAIHIRPLPPLSRGSVPWMSAESIRWLVKVIRAEMPATDGPASELWIALASDFGLGGTGPCP